jgi:SSS family solute:Na+ symporter
MHPVDWVIFIAFTAWIIYDGVKRTKDSDTVDGYFLAKRSIPWWAAGISVMATQLSAITMIGTTGQGYTDGLRFIQFYFALPVAMIILSVTLVPFFYNSGVYTAYEYLERRFDAKTRSFTSLLFLLSRGMSCGAIVSAPAVVLSLVLGWDLTWTSLLITVPAVVYTMFGGVQAVAWTDVKIMFLVVGALFAIIIAAVVGFPSGVGLGDGLSIAQATGRLRTFDFSFDVTNPYTFWSGTIAALFLFCSYFGTDQSQVQRYLTARSVDEARHSLLMSAYWKIPLQFIVLIVGILVFVFYMFTPPPMLFTPVQADRMRSGPAAPQYAALQTEFDAAQQARMDAASSFVAARGSGDAARLDAARVTLREREAALTAVRARAATLVRGQSGDRAYSDTNYIIPHFILTQLPIGLIGLLIVAIIMAATDSIAGELNSLATASVMDFYKRWMKPIATDRHYLRISKILTGAWGVFVGAVAVWAAQLGSLIEVVNRFGSYFYGSILGVFILAIAFKRATGTGAFVGLIAGMGSVYWVATYTRVAFLWQNVVGAVAVVIAGVIVSELGRLFAQTENPRT